MAKARFGEQRVYTGSVDGDAMPEYPRVVAIALLTQSELDLLGKNFRRAFPINNTSGFEDILRAIDEADRRLHDDEPPE